MKTYPVTEELNAADLHARNNPREPGAPAHWCRCNAVVNGKRCVRPDPHPGEHEFPKDPNDASA